MEKKGKLQNVYYINDCERERKRGNKIIAIIKSEAAKVIYKVFMKCKKYEWLWKSGKLIIENGFLFFYYLFF